MVVVTSLVVFFTELQVVDSLDSRVDCIKPQLRNTYKEHRVEVFKWMVGCIVKTTKDLIRSETVGVVVRMSLNSEETR